MAETFCNLSFQCNYSPKWKLFGAKKKKKKISLNNAGHTGGISWTSLMEEWHEAVCLAAWVWISIALAANTLFAYMFWAEPVKWSHYSSGVEIVTEHKLMSRAAAVCLKRTVVCGCRLQQWPDFYWYMSGIDFGKRGAEWRERSGNTNTFRRTSNSVNWVNKTMNGPLLFLSLWNAWFGSDPLCRVLSIRTVGTGDRNISLYFIQILFCFVLSF